MSSSPTKYTSAPAPSPTATRAALEGRDGVLDELVGDRADEDARAEAEDEPQQAPAYLEHQRHHAADQERRRRERAPEERFGHGGESVLEVLYAAADQSAARGEVRWGTAGSASGSSSSPWGRSCATR
jgi:hypothetical protein